MRRSAATALAAVLIIIVGAAGSMATSRSPRSHTRPSVYVVRPGDTLGSIGGRFFRLTAKDGTVYYGAHMSKFGKAGRVRAGDVIGYVGNTGDARTTSAHLHFEIHPGGGDSISPYPTLVAACR